VYNCGNLTFCILTFLCGCSLLSHLFTYQGTRCRKINQRIQKFDMTSHCFLTCSSRAFEAFTAREFQTDLSPLIHIHKKCPNTVNQLAKHAFHLCYQKQCYSRVVFLQETINKKNVMCYPLEGDNYQIPSQGCHVAACIRCHAHLLQI
jgi:hypothetical protein